MAYQLTGAIQEELITGVMIPNVRNASVASQFVKTETIVGSDSIKIVGVGAVATSAYTGGEIAAHNYTDTSVILGLTKGNSFSEKVQQVDTYEAAMPIYPGIIEEGSYQLGQDVDKAVFAKLGAATNTVTAPATGLDKSNIIGWIGEMKAKLTRQGAPALGRKLALSPEMVAVLAEAGIAGNSDSIATDASKEFFVTRFGGFDIYETVNLLAGTGEVAVATAPRGAALGIGFNTLKVDAMPGQVYDIVVGVVVYDSVIVKQEYVVASDATIA